MKVKNYIDASNYLKMTIPFILGLILSFLVIIMNYSKYYFISGIVCLLLLIILFYNYYYRSYIFKEKEMIIRYGFFSRNYKYRQIKKCFITDINIFSYATSKRKLCIELKNKQKIYISPVKMDEVLLMLINKLGR